MASKHILDAFKYLTTTELKIDIPTLCAHYLALASIITKR